MGGGCVGTEGREDRLGLYLTHKTFIAVEQCKQYHLKLFIPNDTEIEAYVYKY
jgi:hypothetical protein